MNQQPVQILHVTLDLGNRQILKMGRLAWVNRRILFEYDPTFLASQLQISPFKLPLKPGVQEAKERLFDGLFGVFNDSLPDGWGRLLLDRQLARTGLNPEVFTPLDRLAFVGTTGMGALRYQPDLSERSTATGPLVLDVLADEASRILEGTPGEMLATLVQLAGSSGGARPKALVQVSNDFQVIKKQDDDVPAGFSPWLIKFAASMRQLLLASYDFLPISMNKLWLNI